MKLFALGSAVAWAGLSAFIVLSAPEVTVSGSAECPTATDGWAKTLAKSGLDITMDTKPAATACPAGEIRGYTLSGAVPPEAIHLLLRKRPSDVTGLILDNTGGVLAQTTAGTTVPFGPPTVGETQASAARR